MQEALRKWLHTVLKEAVKPVCGVPVLLEGKTRVEFDGECVLAWSFDQETREPVYHARIRLVPESPEDD